MLSLKARVRNGHLLLDELTELPEGAEVEMVAVDAEDLLDADERAALDAALDEAIAQDEAGDTVDADEVIGRLCARAS